jgi:hypothetical protein
MIWLSDAAGLLPAPGGGASLPRLSAAPNVLAGILFTFQGLLDVTRDRLLAAQVAAGRDGAQ